MHSPSEKKAIRVLIVDDSALIRRIIADSIDAADGFEVVGQACDGKEAVRLFRQLDVDVVTLDIQMPKMDGLATLDALMEIRPTPIIMVSSLTKLGADITMQALERGALDYVAKPNGMQDAEKVLGNDLLRRISTVAKTDVCKILNNRRVRAEKRKKRREQQGMSTTTKLIEFDMPPLDLSDKMIALGISTGGPPALASMFELLRPPMPPIVIVQHMPEQFTAPFSERLNQISEINVKEAENGDVLKPNCAYVARGGQHLAIRKLGSGGRLLIQEGEPVCGHKPSVDIMMQSAAKVYGSRCLGVIMTGMGFDGSEGCASLRAVGAFVLGQDEASSDVYGMNKVAFNSGHVDRQFTLDHAAQNLAKQVVRQWGPAKATV